MLVLTRKVDEEIYLYFEGELIGTISVEAFVNKRTAVRLGFGGLSPRLQVVRDNAISKDPRAERGGKT